LFSSKRRSNALIVIALVLTAAFAVLPIATIQFAKSQIATAATAPVYTYYNLSYVFSHQNQLKGEAIATRGTVKFMASIFMFEDFWLQAQTNQSENMKVVTREAGLPLPQEGTLIEIQGTIESSNLEGGFYYINASSISNAKNVLLIGWDGVQRNHLFELLNNGSLPNLQSIINDGQIVNVTVSDHRTDTKSGWTQILTGYRWWRTGVFNNVYWFHSIPRGYTIPERAESYFGSDNVATGHITGKMGHMEVINGSSTAATGIFTHEAIYSNIPSQVDVCNVGDRNATIVGPLALQFIENYSRTQFFGFFHFSDPDTAGHTQPSGGENSPLYENAIMRCDNWLGQIQNKLAALNLTQNTLVYVTADHGFDEGGYSHNFAPYISLVTNDKRVTRNGDQIDVAPTAYYGLGMWGKTFEPSIDGYPLQISLPAGEEERRQSVLADLTAPPKTTISSPTNGATVSGTVPITFNASDKYLSAVLFLVNNTLKSDGPWTWTYTNTVQANGLYNFETANLNPGAYSLTLLAFDEHGASNGQSNSTITVKETALQPSPTPNPTPKPAPKATTAPTSTPMYTAAPTPTATTLPAITDNGATIHLTINGNISSSQMSSVTIATNKSASTTTLSFTIMGQSGETGFGNVTIPKCAITYGTTPVIFIDNQPAQDQGYTQDSDNYYVWYTTHFSTHQVSIVFAAVSSSSLPVEAIYGITAVAVVVLIVTVAVVLRRARQKLKNPNTCWTAWLMEKTQS
jgi:hypothetical protein